MLLLRMLAALMLMIVLREADGVCPPELNPLTLDIPKVIGKQGEEVMVNCTSTKEDHDGMHWIVKGSHDSGIEDEKSFIPLMLPLSDWNVTAECKIKLNKFTECSKNLEIIIYQNPAVYVFPTDYAGAVVEGSLYELQCNILSAAPVQNLTVRWYRDNHTIQTDFFHNHTEKGPKDVSSTLMVNVSREDSGARLRCEAQLDFGLDHPPLPAVSDELRLVPVHYAPELNNQSDIDFVHVTKGADVSLSCDVEGSPPPVFHWACDGVNMSENTNSLILTHVNTSTNCSCTATNHVGRIILQIHVSVTEITKMAAPAAMTTPKASTPRVCPITLTPAEIMVRFGHPVSINCSTSAANAQMGWEAVIEGIALQDSSSVTWMVKKMEDFTLTPLCYITMEDGYQCIEKPNITLYKTPDIVQVSAKNPLMYLGREYQLTCEVINVAPVRPFVVKWYRGSQLVDTQMGDLNTVVPINTSFHLTVTADRDDNGAAFTCETELQLGPNGPNVNLTTASSPFIAVVYYEPVIRSCPGHYSGVEYKLSLDKLSCEADGNPPPSVQWSYQGKPINASEYLTRTHTGKYTAEFVNSLGHITTSVDITIEYSPPPTCKEHCEVKEHSEFKTRCEPKAVPEPTVTWVKDGKAMAAPQRWTKDHSGNYSLTATNKHGTAKCNISLDVLYAPVYNEGNHSRELTPGENVTLVCHAEGNPPPQVHWAYPSTANVVQSSGGRHQTIVVTGATSTNAGVYNCTATNKVGRVTRSVTLMMKGKTSGFPLPVVWGLLIFLVLVAILILVIISYKQGKKHGQYSFVSSNAKDGLDISMTSKSSMVA